MKIVILILSIVICLSSFAQKTNNANTKKERFPSYFGLQFKPLFATNFLSASELKLTGTEHTATYKQRFGFSFGGTVRIGLHKIVNLETGLNFVQRNYNIDFTINSPTTQLTAQTDFRIVSYDIPVNALFYIRLSEKFYMNASLGASLGYVPFNVWKPYIINSYEKFQSEGRRSTRFYGEVNGNVGFEYRTPKSGFFYLGASMKVPFRPIFHIAASYETASYKRVETGLMSGSYLTLDLRYYFKNNGEKNRLRGPIEQ